MPYHRTPAAFATMIAGVGALFGGFFASVGPVQAGGVETVASIADAPWQASIWHEDMGGHICGAVLIAPDWALTTANCVDPDLVPNEKIKVKAGTIAPAKDGETLAVADIITHPGYDDKTQRNNIALLHLATPSTLGTPIALPSGDTAVAPGTVLHVTGWGTTSIQQELDRAQTMIRVDLPTVSNDRCNQPQSYDGLITDDMLCAGFKQGGVDACLGFSGSPAVRGDSDLIGLAAWGKGCGFPDKFGVYTRVSAFTDWIAVAMAQ